MPDTGAPYFIPYVEPTDLVRDYPDASEDLALAIVAALENIPVTEKRIEAFTGSGTWTVPAGVTYAIAHMLSGGGGGGNQTTDGSNGGASSVAFASGTKSAPVGVGGPLSNGADASPGPAQVANSGRGGESNRFNTRSANDAQWNVHGAAVTPAASITVTVGAGGAAASGARAGGSGFVYIEYFEEV